MPSHNSLCLLALLAGCAPAPEVASAVHIDTLPNGALHVRSDAPRWPKGAGWRVAQDLAIGGAEDGPADFADIRGVAADDAGRIYVLDAQAALIQMFNADGTHLRTIGRKGAGPGEFTQPIGIAIHRGRLVVVDQQNVRISLFDTSGALLATHPRVYANIGVGIWQGGLDTSGAIIEQLGQWPTDGSMETVWSLAPLDSASFTPTDTFPLPAFRGKQLVVEHKSAGGGSRATAIPPYAPHLSWVFEPRGTIWFGVSDRFQLVQRRAHGDTVRVIERAWEPEQLSDSVREAALERLSWFTKQGGTVSLSDIPATRPAFGLLVVDDAGNLWVGPYSSQSRSWTVFDTAGQWLGPVDFPAPIQQLMVRGDRYYGVVRDSLDVLQVVRGTVTR